MPIYEVVATTTRYDMAELDPPEDSCEWFIVNAPSAKKAKVAAVKEARRRNKEWWDCGCSPFTNLEAHDVSKMYVKQAKSQGCYLEVAL